MRKKLAIIAIVILIACIASLCYGRNCLQTVIGETNPDNALAANPEMPVNFSVIEADYFLDDVESLTEIEEASTLIVKVTVTTDRLMYLQSTKTAVIVDTIYQDDDNRLSEGDTIYIQEPTSFVRGDFFLTYGWQYMQTGKEYLLFLKHLESVDGYRYKGETAITYMPVSQLFAKYDIDGEETGYLVEESSSVDLSYTEIGNSAMITEDEDKLQLYEELWQVVKSKYL